LSDDRRVFRHVLAPISPDAARALSLPRTLPGAGVAITFDDGPHPEGTPAVLEILAAAGAHATFFLIGEQVERRPELARRILDEGHGIALHGHRHRLQLRLSAGQLRDDLARGIAAIEDATGTTPTLHRPPYGIYSPSGLQLARDRNLQPLLWSAWGKDWRKFTTAERIAARATRNLQPGSVILLHDADFYSARGSHEHTIQALPAILARLKAGGFGTVSAV
jgi:peptidoglycan/xylan/chitin deacetylase (PgdA/CDA1 family)